MNFVRKPFAKGRGVQPDQATSPAHRGWYALGFGALLATLAASQAWGALSFLAILAFLVWFARLAVSIPPAPPDWKLQDGILNQHLDLFVKAGLSARLRNQVPRWILFLAVLLAAGPLLDRVPETIPAWVLLAASGLLAVVGLVLIFTEPRPR